MSPLVVELDIETAERLLEYFRIEYGKDTSNIPAVASLEKAIARYRENENALVKYTDAMEAANS